MPMPPMIDIATAPVRGKRSPTTASMVGQKNVLPTRVDGERDHRAREGVDAADQSQADRRQHRADEEQADRETS